MNTTKIFLFNIDHDKTMRSSKLSEKAFITKIAAENYGKEKGYIKDEDYRIPEYSRYWDIQEIELIEE